jgi:hypothetical protein
VREGSVVDDGKVAFGTVVVVVVRAGWVVVVVACGGAVVDGAAGSVVVVVVVGSAFGTTTTDDPDGTRTTFPGSVRTNRYRIPSPMNSTTMIAVERRMRTRGCSGSFSVCEIWVSFMRSATLPPAS